MCAVPSASTPTATRRTRLAAYAASKHSAGLTRFRSKRMRSSRWISFHCRSRRSAQGPRLASAGASNGGASRSAVEMRDNSASSCAREGLAEQGNTRATRRRSVMTGPRMRATRGAAFFQWPCDGQCVSTLVRDRPYFAVCFRGRPLRRSALLPSGSAGRPCPAQTQLPEPLSMRGRSVPVKRAHRVEGLRLSRPGPVAARYYLRMSISTYEAIEDGVKKRSSGLAVCGFFEGGLPAAGAAIRTRREHRTQCAAFRHRTVGRRSP